jgi:predicted alpha/beta superfamily hydrolase
MLALAILTLSSIVHPQDSTRTSSLTGNVDHVPSFESKILGNKRNLIVYLPPAYEKEKPRRYPVLYCHDGQNIFDGKTSFIPNKEWRIDEAAEALIKARLIEPIIIVGIDNAGSARGDEYVPWPVQMSNGAKFGGRADLYGRFLLEEVKPFIDQKYRTKSDGRNTALMGSSLGGLVTMYLGLKYPDRFSKLGVVSPSVWVNEREIVKSTDKLPKKLPLKIWIDMGAQEGGDSLEDARALFNSLHQKGWRPGKDLALYEDGFAQHNEEAWARRMPAFLLWMFGTNK